MIIKIDNYNLGRRIVSFARSKEIEEDLKNNNLDALLLEEKSIYFWRDRVRIKVDKKTKDRLSYCNNYDVFQINEDGQAYVYYSNELDDNVFMLTEKCNSNCIMCPTGNFVRKNGGSANIVELLDIIQHIPTDAKHFTITGGEPFLIGKQLFLLLKAFKNKFKYTEYLLLTNGRALSIPDYAKMFNELAPHNMVVGIPIHGHIAQLHDKITRTPGGFQQTVSGVNNLLKHNRRVELRIIVSLLNYKHIYEIAKLIIRKFPLVESVKIMGMEMTGSAAVNKELLWISYEDAFQASKQAIMELIDNEIDVALYNFPLCTVDEPFRMLCKKSITDYKIRFADICTKCTLRDACGGVFAGTFRLVENNLRPEVGK